VVDATAAWMVDRVTGQCCIQLLFRHVFVSNSFLAKFIVANDDDSTNSILVADISKILNAIEAGEPKAAAQLLPLVYTNRRAKSRSPTIATGLHQIATAGGQANAT
jgi:hypothetical protein